MTTRCVRCTRCLLPATYPGVTFDDAGVCNHCLAHMEPEPLGAERLLEKIHARRGAQYDVALGISGGKDRLLAHALQGAEIIMGKNPNWRRQYRAVICVGACTRRVAEEGGYLYIPGCPPTLEDFYNQLA